MKRKTFLIWLLTGMLAVTGMTGCSNKAETEGTEKEAGEAAGTEEAAGWKGKGGAMAENQVTEEELAAYEAADAIEIEELSLITDWKEQASITLGDSISINGTGAAIEDGNVIKITQGGAYTFTGTLKDGMIAIDTEDAVKLVLNGASITNDDNSVIYGYNSKTCYIETAAGTENSLTDQRVSAEADGAEETAEESEEKGKAAVFSNDELVFLGEGSLTISGGYKHAAASDDHIFVESGSLLLTAEKDGMHTNDWICIDGGSIDISCSDDAMQSEGPVSINGGNIAIAADDKGITAYGDLTVNDGNITMSSCTEGLESKNDFYMNGGTAKITCSDDGVNARNSLTVNDGILYTMVSAGDGLDSNGTMEIHGGQVFAFGGMQPECGADCDQNKIIITGGLLIAAGGSNSAPSETDSSQISVLLGSAKTGDTIGIKNEAGETVFAFEVQKDYSNMLLSTGTIAENMSYTVYTGGTIKGESVYGYYENGSYEGGTESVTFETDSMVVSAGGTSDSMGGRDGMGGRGGMNGQMPEGGMPNGEMPDGEMPQMPGSETGDENMQNDGL